MTASSKSIEAFISATQTVTASQDLSHHLAALQAWRQQFFTSMAQHRISAAHFMPQADIAQCIEQVNSWQTRVKADSDLADARLADAHHLMAQFEQKVILLLFGKFNAGKSSLCNVLAEYFSRYHQSVQYFYLEAGQLVFTQEKFKEGATETTARLQGVCLGERLILLDTPGLHSVTQANAALTQRFLESADGVLWLTSSSSPGQVHELDELAQELLRKKPLLPVITRSDYFEEDEVDGDIVQVLCNKPESQRQLQETDVQARAAEKLIQLQADLTLLKSPLSLSAYCLIQSKFSDEAMSAAGFERLFAALIDLIVPALAYKQRKPAEILLHDLQEHTLTPFTQGFITELTKLEIKIHLEQESLDYKKQQIIEHAWREVVPTIPTLLEKYQPLDTLDSLLNDIADKVNLALPVQIVKELPNSTIVPQPWVTLPLVNNLNYQPDDDNPKKLIINENQLYKTICDSLRKSLTQAMDDWIANYHEQLCQVLEQSEVLKVCIHDYQQQLQGIAADFRQ